MAKYQENFIDTTSFIKRLLNIKMVTLLLGHPVFEYIYIGQTTIRCTIPVFAFNIQNTTNHSTW